MQLNGKDVSSYGGKKRTIVLGNAELSNGSTWIAGSVSPYLEDNQIGFKTLTITLWMKGSSTSQIKDNISDLLAELVEISEISDPDLSHKFKGYLKKHSKKVLIEGRNTILTLEFSGYEFSDGTIIKTATQSFTADTGGNLRCPVVLEITPKASGTLTVSGFTDDPFTISNAVEEQKIVIDGLTGEMSAGGASKAKDIDIWELPRLLPGSNMITISASSDITIRYEARYM